MQKNLVTAYAEYNFPAICQRIHNFCTVELGSFYLDVIKDRQYTSYRTGIPRRSAQTALYYIVEALVRWLAPILSFTAEEIWGYLPGKRSTSVLLTNWYEFPQSTETKPLNGLLLMQVREAVNKVLEAHRQVGEIGSALDAEVILYANEALFSQLSSLGEELRFVLITSDAKVLPLTTEEIDFEPTELPGLFIKVIVSTHEKCLRCWQRRPTVDSDLDYPGICDRCVQNMESPGEVRHYA